MLFGLMSKYYTRTNTTLNYLYTPGGWRRKTVFWMNCSLILYIDDNINAYRIAGSLEDSVCVCVEIAQQTFTLCGQWIMKYIFLIFKNF